jgi:hypothetical protein
VATILIPAVSREARQFYKRRHPIPPLLFSVRVVDNPSGADASAPVRFRIIEDFGHIPPTKIDAPRFQLVPQFALRDALIEWNNAAATHI